MSRSYLAFLSRGITPGRRTVAVDVYSRSSGNPLGAIVWYPAWSQYVFQPFRDTVWSDGCLAEVRAKVSELNAEQKRAAAAPQRVAPPPPGSVRPGKA